MAVRDLIAVVGMAGRFPGSGADLEQFWANICGAIDCSRDVPEGRWNLPIHSAVVAGGPSPDAVYTSRSYSLDPFEPDLTSLAIEPTLVSELDPLFHLVLDVGGRAWQSFDSSNADRRKVGIILGNICLPTDKSNDLAREILGGKLADALGRPRETIQTNPLNHFAAGLPAGLLAKALGFGLGSFTLDAACSSSLYAIKLAADELLAGRAEVMLAGGCSRPDALYTQMGFSQLRALSPTGTCSPFDEIADGLVVGEGAGIFVLKRLADAIAHGDPIHAVLHGAGLSNDVSGNLLAPAVEGQVRAMKSAYESAGWEPHDIDLIECHATGTPVGDAIEFEAIKQLWANSVSRPGQCIIGSVKSTVGHLLTGAGAAAVMKIILAFQHRTLPPQANFWKSSKSIEMSKGPFRVLQKAEPWIERSAKLKLKAAVSGFGFGGVNAHLLFANEPTDHYLPQTSKRPTPTPIAVVGMATHVGPFETLREYQERIFNTDSERIPRPKLHGWELADAPCPAGQFIEELSIAVDRFRIPPKELEEMLPQQLAALVAAVDALDDVRRQDGNDSAKTPPPRAADFRSGVFLGVSLDPNTTNYHLRWATKRHGADLADSASPPLTADRTMGALASCAASRIAKTLQWGGPAFTVCSEEASGGRALELAVRALQRGELDRAIAGGVDFTGDPRTITAYQRLDGFTGIHQADGAAAVVLKRLADAERDGDRIYAVILGVGTSGGGRVEAVGPDSAAIASSLVRALADANLPAHSVEWIQSAGSPGYRVAEETAVEAFAQSTDRPISLGFTTQAETIGQSGAASFLMSFVSGCLSVYHEIIPPSKESRKPQYWLSNRKLNRRLAVSGLGIDGTVIHALLDEHQRNKPQPVETRSRSTVERRQPLGARDEAVFAIEYESIADAFRLIEELNDLTSSYLSTERLARTWFTKHRPDPRKRRAMTFVPRSVEELREQLAFARNLLEADPETNFVEAARTETKWRDRVFHATKPLSRLGKLAFVFPGSGNHFATMGQSLGTAWPEVLRRQQTENEFLRDQYSPSRFWVDAIPNSTKAPDYLFGQVSTGSLGADLLQSLAIKADVMVGISLGESAGLFGMRIWRTRDEMLRRIKASTLFHSDLAPPYDSARQFFGWSENGQLDWTVGVIQASPDDIRSILRPRLRAYLLMVTAPNECVIGGLQDDVIRLADQLGGRFVQLDGVTLAHCEAGKPVERPYRELHSLPVSTVAGLKVFSGAWARSYHPTEANAADSITTGLLNVIDVPAIIEAAYRDGVRIFVEVGPGSSATRSISAILKDRPHLVRSISASRQSDVSLVLRLVAQLISERVSVDLGALYGRETACFGHLDKPLSNRLTVTVPVGLTGAPIPVLMPTGDDSSILRRGLPPSNGIDLSHFPEPPMGWHAHDSAVGVDAAAAAEFPAEVDLDEDSIMPSPLPRTRSIAAAKDPLSIVIAETPEPTIITTPVPINPMHYAAPTVMAAAISMQEAGRQAHETFLSVQAHATSTTATLIDWQGRLLRQLMGSEESTSSLVFDSIPRSLNNAQCFEFARGRIGNVLGSQFAEIDAFPTRVRLPDQELMLVDRILSIEGEPKSMSKGRVVTDHAVHDKRWYLDAGVCPTSITVESGQADLFLSGFLGIDFQTKGLAVYRLLDAVVTFHRGLPEVGETITYDIHIDEFFRQADSWLFRFHFEGSIHGQPMLSMKNGIAGFFSREALDAGKGIIHTKLDLQAMPGKKPDDWIDFVNFEKSALDTVGVNALREGNLVAAFGESFRKMSIQQPMKLPGGKLRLVDRVPLIEAKGGRFGLGFVRAEYDINPKDWFLTCHFVDDRVMPGTLMYECCLHTLRILLMRMGWVGEEGQVVCEPVPGVNSRLKCRGQVIESSKLVTYEVTIKELGYSPEPFCIADALMYADGKPIVEISNMSLQMSGLTRSKLEQFWTSQRLNRKPALYDTAKIIAYSNGNPSDAFGEPYRIFDQGRVLARLPGPPYQFLDRVTAVTGEPFVLKAGASCETEYDVPQEEWYFRENRCGIMPFSILLEVALQPCGWLAAYCGSALTSPSDLSFRNLGGKGTQRRAITPNCGTLTVRATMTNVSQSAGMIIQHYSMTVSDSVGIVYEGTTYFGFFGKEALKNQVGMPTAKVPFPGEMEALRAESTRLPFQAPFPGKQLRMVDRIPQFVRDGGRAGLGLVVGTITVDSLFWFFKAHFFQDPVWPGSLGLESFLQLLKFVAWERWKTVPEKGWQTVALNQPHEWTYRGQVVPEDHEVTVVLEVTAVDDEIGRLTADGFLLVDGRIIYQMKDFTLE